MTLSWSQVIQTQVKKVFVDSLDFLSFAQPLALIAFLYGVTCAEHARARPLHASLGSEEDTVVFALLKLLTLLLLYAPNLPERVPRFARSLIILSALAFFNPHTFHPRASRTWMLDATAGGFLTAHALYVTRDIHHGTVITIVACAASWVWSIMTFPPPLFTGMVASVQGIWLMGLWWIWWRQDVHGRGCSLGIRVSLVQLTRGVFAVTLLYVFAALTSSWLHFAWSQSIEMSGFSGLTWCHHAVRTEVPTNRTEVQALVRAQPSLRARGAGHSWNSFGCPTTDGVVLDVRELRAFGIVNVSTGHFRVGAGASMGSLVNYMMRHGYALPSFWVSDITVGGAVATGVHNEGIGFFECCVREATLIDGLSTVRVLTENDTAFAYLPGSLGRLGMFVEFVVQGVPLTGLSFRTTRYPRNVVNATVLVEGTSPKTNVWITKNYIITQNDSTWVHETHPHSRFINIFQFSVIS